MVLEHFAFATDTATLCVFDLETLKHRLADDADWWSLPEDELSEMNAGNVAFLNLRDDGAYDVGVVEVAEKFDVEIFLRFPSGRVFIGAGEEVTSDEMEPSGICGGKFMDFEPGNYVLRAKRVENRIWLSLGKGGGGSNAFEELVFLD